MGDHQANHEPGSHADIASSDRLATNNHACVAYTPDGEADGDAYSYRQPQSFADAHIYPTAPDCLRGQGGRFLLIDCFQVQCVVDQHHHAEQPPCRMQFAFCRAKVTNTAAYADAIKLACITHAPGGDRHSDPDARSYPEDWLDPNLS